MYDWGEKSPGYEFLCMKSSRLLSIIPDIIGVAFVFDSIADTEKLELKFPFDYIICIKLIK